MEYDIYEKPVQVLSTQAISEKEKPLEEKAPLPNMDLPNIEIPSIDDTYYPSTNPQEIERLIREQIEYGIMCQRYDRGQLDNLVSIMTEVMLCTADMIPISREKAYSADYVQSCIRKVGSMHIEQIMEYLIANRPEIRNVRGYLLAALINTANTLDMSYDYGEQYAL